MADYYIQTGNTPTDVDSQKTDINDRIRSVCRDEAFLTVTNHTHFDGLLLGEIKSRRKARKRDDGEKPQTCRALSLSSEFLFLRVCMCVAYMLFIISDVTVR